MHISNMEISNFKGLEHIAFRPDSYVNVIVGPNAIGKTTLLEAVRLVKAILAPRYFQETQQTLISLGAMSPQFQFFGTQQMDLSVLVGDIAKPLKISLEISLSENELTVLRQNVGNLALAQLRSQLGRNDEQGQFVLTQYLSSEQGRTEQKAASSNIESQLIELGKSRRAALDLTLNPDTKAMAGRDAFSQHCIAFLDQSLPAQSTLFSYFPADRAFPSGEVSIQIGSVDASNQVQSHLGNPATKYHRLKQSLVQGVITHKITEEWLNNEFNFILENLLPGKSFDSVQINTIGQCKVVICDTETNRKFDIDNLSSGEKGVILTFLLIRQTLAKGGILLIDEPELHLNPGIQRKLLPFLIDHCVAPLEIQAFVCTHSPEVLAAAYDRDNSSLFHLRSGIDLTKIYRKDHAEMFEALRRLGASTADVLFSRGNVFVEGDHDAEVLTEGFWELLSGFKVTKLGGRNEVEKEIDKLKKADKTNDLNKLNLFIFDLDRKISNRDSTRNVIVRQWDRYCLENYLLNEKILFDKVSLHATRKPESRGSFSHSLKEIALSQITGVVVREVYAELEPDNPGIRSGEIAGKPVAEIAEVLVGRLLRIAESTAAVDKIRWIEHFIGRVNNRSRDLSDEWQIDWIKKCNGKIVIQALYKKYEINIDNLSFKREVIRQMREERTEEWVLLDSIIRNGLKLT